MSIWRWSRVFTCGFASAARRWRRPNICSTCANMRSWAATSAGLVESAGFNRA